MSYVFVVDDLTVWSPALRIGGLYIQMADALSAWARMPTGLSAMASDYYNVDPEQLSTFVRALLTAPGSQNPMFVHLARPFIVVALAMLERAGRPLLDPEALALVEPTAWAAGNMPD